MRKFARFLLCLGLSLALIVPPTPGLTAAPQAITHASGFSGMDSGNFYWFNAPSIRTEEEAKSLTVRWRMSKVISASTFISDRNFMGLWNDLCEHMAENPCAKAIWRILPSRFVRISPLKRSPSSETVGQFINGSLNQMIGQAKAFLANYPFAWEHLTSSEGSSGIFIFQPSRSSSIQMAA